MLSEAGRVQMCTAGKILLAASEEKSPDGESSSRDSQAREARSSPARLTATRMEEQGQILEIFRR